MIDGGWNWLQDSHGLLTRQERAALLGRLARVHVHNVVGRIRLLTRRLPADLARLDLAQLTPPDSRWAREAEAAAAGQPPPLLGHVYRTWAYAVALAHLDRVRPDPEVLYVACLLHDAGLVGPTRGVCFTTVGARAALASGERAQAPRRSAEQAAETIAMHLWPPARPARHGPETSYLAAGAALDVVGLRSWDLDPATVEQVLARWPRAGFVDDLVRRWRAECAAVRGGRADFLRRYGGFLLAARLAPFPDRDRGRGRSVQELTPGASAAGCSATALRRRRDEWIAAAVGSPGHAHPRPPT